MTRLHFMHLMGSKIMDIFLKIYLLYFIFFLYFIFKFVYPFSLCYLSPHFSYWKNFIFIVL